MRQFSEEEILNTIKLIFCAFCLFGVIKLAFETVENEIDPSRSDPFHPNLNQNVSGKNPDIIINSQEKTNNIIRDYRRHLQNIEQNINAQNYQKKYDQLTQHEKKIIKDFLQNDDVSGSLYYDCHFHKAIAWFCRNDPNDIYNNALMHSLYAYRLKDYYHHFFYNFIFQDIEYRRNMVKNHIWNHQPLL